MSQFVLPYPFLGRSPFVTTRRFLIALITITLVTLAFSFDFAPQVSTITPNRMIFVPNRGQTDASVQFLAHQGSNRWLFTQNEIIYSWVTPENETEALIPSPTSLPQFHTGTLRQQFLGVNEDARFAAAEPLPGKVNYLLNNDPSQWYKDLPTYGAIKIQSLYQGIDVTYMSQGNGYDTQYVVLPGAELNHIRWQYKGEQGVELDEYGQLTLTTTDFAETLIVARPKAMQIINNKVIFLETQYVQYPDGSIGLNVEKHNPQYPIRITVNQPSSSPAFDSVQSIVIDELGNAYVAGYTYASDFPLVNALQPAFAGQVDAFVTKLMSDGSGAVYSTYLGGSGADFVGSVALDNNGYLYIAGATDSLDFPMANPWQSNFGGVFDSFIAKLNPDGTSLIFSTYFGGSDLDSSSEITNDQTGYIIFSGVTHSCDFPILHPLQGNCTNSSDGFIGKLSPDGQTLVFSTYVGGSDYDVPYDIGTDDQNNIYVIGETTSDDFPLFNPLQNVYAGSTDAFVSKLTFDGQTLVFSTYLGGYGSDHARAIMVHSDGTASVSGYTSSYDFPIVNAYQPVLGGYSDVFITRFSATGDIWLYSTYLGGSDGDYGMGLEIDNADNYYVTATTFSTDFPIVNAVQPVNGGYQDTVVAKLNAAGSALVFSTYVGGESSEFVSSVAVDEANNVYVAGETWSTAFPTTPGAWQENYAGGGDGFVTKILADGSAFGYSTYLGGGFPTDVTVTDVRGVAYDGWLTGLFTSGVVYLVIGYWVWRYRRGRKGIV